MQKTIFGSSIEAKVCAFLELNRLRCVQKNYRCRLGEIDLIMQDQDDQSLVFVEVRFRSRAQFGSATESVDWTKQRKLKRTALHYLQKHADAKQIARVDVIGVCNLAADTGESSDALELDSGFGVSNHQYEGYLLRWTRNAIED